MNTTKGSLYALRANSKATEMKDKKVILSSLWIFATLNYLYADVFTLYLIAGGKTDGNATRGCVGIRNINGNCACHGSPVPGIEVWCKSLGKHRRRRIPYRVCVLVAVWRNATSFLYVFCSDRNSLYFVHCLVCLEVAQP